MEDKDRLRIQIANSSDLITKVEILTVDDQPTIYIHHKNKQPNQYLCACVSARGLFINSNSYHDFHALDALSKAVEIARKGLDL